MNKIKVSGVAVKSGLSLNQHKFLAEELNSAVTRAQGKTFPLLKDHKPLTDNTIGRVSFKTSYVNEKGETVVPFEGFAIEDGTQITLRIKEGVINEVSIGAHAERMVKESEEDTAEIPIGITFAELSTTPTPAVADTSISTLTNTTTHPVVGESTTSNHTIVVQSSTQEQSKCPECDETFTDKESMQAHMDKKHKKNTEENKMAEMQEKSELQKVQEELENLKLELAKAEKAKIEAQLAEQKKQAVAQENVSVLAPAQEQSSPFVIKKTGNAMEVTCDWKQSRMRQIGLSE